MSKLRERQKQNRRNAILTAAKSCFRKHGFSASTIEMIANDADLSAVTIFNYYGTKEGVLISVVNDSDDHLIDKLQKLNENCCSSSAKEAVIEYLWTIFQHAMECLDRDTWRFVIAASLTQNEADFGLKYAELEARLAQFLGSYLELLNQRSMLDCSHTNSCARVLYDSYNAHFLRYITNRTLSEENFRDLVEQDVKLVIEPIMQIHGT